MTSSAAAASSQSALQPRSSGTFTRLPVRNRVVREADSRWLALPAVRHSSMTRAGLLALARVHEAIRDSHA